MLKHLGLAGNNNSTRSISNNNNIVPLSDLGYFGWMPLGGYRSVGSATADEIRQQVNLTALPDSLLVDLQKTLQPELPRPFKTIEPVLRRNQYPYGQDYIASLYVAKRDRNLDLNQVDFLFGSYTLFFLATEKPKENGEKYVVAKVPGTNVVLVTRYKLYEDNVNHFGPQFERLVTGSDSLSNTTVQHIHLIKIGNAQILFSGQVDAADATTGEPTEIKLGIKRFLVLNIIMQAIGSGSTRICVGEYQPQNGSIHLDYGTTPRVLERVELSNVEDIRTQRSLSWVRGPITRNVNWLQKQCRMNLDHGVVKELHFLPKQKGQKYAPLEMRDTDVSMDEIFPCQDVVLDLLAGNDQQ